MDSHRVDGIKYNFDRLTDEELAGIRNHLLEKHARVVADIALCETVLLQRHQTPLPGIEFDDRVVPDIAGRDILPEVGEA